MHKWIIATVGCMALSGCGSSASNPAAPVPSETASSAAPVRPAEVTLAPFADEKLLFDQSDVHAFAEAGKARFPEIGQVPFQPDATMTGDAVATTRHRDSFYAGLYYAKMLRLVSGSTLFDLVTRCGGPAKPPAGAALTHENGKTIVSIQFLPNFHQFGSVDLFERGVTIERSGSTFRARAPGFSTGILTRADFLNQAGLHCL